MPLLLVLPVTLIRFDSYSILKVYPRTCKWWRQIIVLGNIANWPQLPSKHFSFKMIELTANAHAGGAGDYD
jgi:hypothetical protein